VRLLLGRPVGVALFGVRRQREHVVSPLTALQNYLLRRDGQTGYRGGFISHYLIQASYPPGLTRGIQLGLGLFVVLSATAGYGGYLRRHGLARAWRAGH
jgi:hypothetical protein